MQHADKPAFGLLVTGYLQEIYEKSVSKALLTVWFESLKPYTIGDIEAGFARYVSHPEDCRFAPKPGDIIRHLPLAKPEDDGRPSPDEAWGMLLRLVRDESETGVLNDEMRTGWTACQPILDVGDEVGARRCFIETYNRAVTEARANGLLPHWTVTLGTDTRLRQERIAQAVKLGRIGADHAVALLPGPSDTAIEGVAGLLEGPDATAQDRSMAERLHGLALMLRKTISADDDRKAAEQKAKRQNAAERQRAAVELMREKAIQNGEVPPPHAENPDEP